jgi:DNA-directed RNA polymerase beta' subunit
MSEIKLLDIDYFINKNNCLEVKNSKLPSEKTGYDPLSLWSELVFGTYGSKERKSRFGYIDLKVNVIHPIALELVRTVSEETSRIIAKKRNYIVKNEILIEDPMGETGLIFLIENFNNINFTKICKKEKQEVADFIEKNKKILIINKWLVIPAAYRDINFRDKNSFKLISEINDFYKDLIFIIGQLSGMSDLDQIFIERLQYKTFQITDWIKKNKLTGKSGIFRGTLLKKRMDYTSRLILLSSTEIKMNEVGIPWHTAMAIFEPIFSYNLFKKNTAVLDDIKQYLETDSFGQDDFIKFVKDVTANPEAVPESLIEKLKPIANEICKDQIVIVKRDPVTDRNSYFAATPIIIPGRTATINSLQLKPLNGDTLKGSVIVYDSSYNPSVVNLNDFPDKYSLKFLSYNKDDRWVYEVEDEIYSLSVNPLNGNIGFNKIKFWHVHTNVNFYKIEHELFSAIVGERFSCFVYNINVKRFEKISVLNIHKDPSIYLFVKLIGKIKNIKETNLGLDQNLKRLADKKVIKLIPASEVKISSYIEGDYRQIELNELPTNLSFIHTGFDLTIDNDQRNFLHSDNLFVCNSDGDTISIVPLFTEEAKNEAKRTMMAGVSDTKNNSLSNYGKSIYSLWLDTISTLYKITREQ